MDFQRKIALLDKMREQYEKYMKIAPRIQKTDYVDSKGRIIR